jgi:hypothetical protein
MTIKTIEAKQKKEKQLVLGLGLASLLIAFSIILFVLNYV